MAEKMLSKAGFVVIGRQSGYTVISKNSPLARLNYFDGKFLRAPDLKLEQRALLSQVRLSNQAGGSGVVHGYDCTLASGDRLCVGAGLAIDPRGRVLHLPEEIHVGIADLIERSRAGNAAIRRDSTVAEGASEFDDCTLRAEQEPGEVLAGSDLYLITVGHAEAYCGEEDVYGKLCEEACISSTERPYIVEGVVIRAVPLNLSTLLPTSSAVPLSHLHLRSRVASAYFKQECQSSPASHISGEGLSSTMWCLGADATSGADVPLALVACSGSTTRFIDAWIARRERMESPPRHYWAWRMAMRPWDVFLAQVLQFQCQLAQCFKDGVENPPSGDPCEEERTVVAAAAKTIKLIRKQYAAISASIADAAVVGGLPEENLISVAELSSLQEKLAAIRKTGVANRYLINCGIVELPSAGYLPVSAVDTMTVNEQIRRMMGEGVDLRFCVVRPDFVAHALEKAQHMERISLLKGLDDPTHKPKVDILVPEGEIAQTNIVANGTGYEMTLDLFPIVLHIIGGNFAGESNGGAFGEEVFGASVLHTAQRKPVSFRGAARGELLPSGGFGFHFAGEIGQVKEEGPPAFTLIELLQQSGAWITAELDRDPFSMNRNESTRIGGEIIVLIQGSVLMRSIFNGDLQIGESQMHSGRHRLGTLLSATMTTTVTNQADGNQQSNVTRLSDKVDIARVTNDGSQPFVEVDFPSPGLLGSARRVFRFESTRRWIGTETAIVEGGLNRISPNQPAGPSFTLVELTQQIPLFRASQTVNPAVLAPAHSAHDSAITALRSIGNALKEPQFEDIAVRKLFPPPKSTPAEIQVRASRDWVLFHRRREQQCAGDKAPEPEIPTRRYRVYLVDLRNDSQRQTLHRGLLNNDAGIIIRFKPVQIGLVEFASGIQTLESPVDVIRAEWQGKAPDRGEIVYGAVASTGDVLDEGEALARSRLANLGNVLSAVTPLSDDPQIEMLQSIPDATIISAAPHDGVMVLATAPLVTICHQVFRLKATKQIVTRLLQSIAGTGAATIAEVLKKFEVESMGRAVFKEGEKEILESASDDLKQAWSDQGGGEVSRVILVNQRPADANAPTEAEKTLIELFVNQASTIAQTVGTEIPPNQVTVRPPEDAEPLSPCPAITIVVNLTD